MKQGRTVRTYLADGPPLNFSIWTETLKFLGMRKGDGQIVRSGGVDGPPLLFQFAQRRCLSECLEYLNGGRSAPMARTVREVW